MAPAPDRPRRHRHEPRPAYQNQVQRSTQISDLQVGPKCQMALSLPLLPLVDPTFPLHSRRAAVALGFGFGSGSGSSTSADPALPLPWGTPSSS
jgi:hypothetical protein